MKTWSADNPKASLMKRKRGAIVEAARQAFLENGYAQTSMDRIAETAGVSIKTVYRHFENKDDLFSAVMQAACSPGGFEELKGKKQDQAPLGCRIFATCSVERRAGFISSRNPRCAPVSRVGSALPGAIRRAAKCPLLSLFGSLDCGGEVEGQRRPTCSEYVCWFTSCRSL